MTPVDRLAEDARARERALELASFLVEAPAGAGKTELLTQRFLRLLTTVDAPEEVIAITFTRKAAGEMRQRIVAALSAARDGTPVDKPHRQVTRDLALAALAHGDARDWRLLAQPARLRLTTIDALCTSLARQMPLLSRFGAQPAVSEDVAHAYRDAAQRTLDHLDDGDAHADDIAVVLDHLDNDGERLVRLLAGMLARRDQWQALATMAQPAQAVRDVLGEIIAVTLQRAVRACPPDWQAAWMPLARFAAANRDGGPLADWCEPLPATADALPQWLALAGQLLTATDTPRKKVTKNDGFPADKALASEKSAMEALLATLTPAQVAALAEVRRLPRSMDIDAALVGALLRLLLLAAAELWLVFRERGEVDFVELSARAIAALGNADVPTDLALHLDYRIRHLLVDEFQDTSPTQVELLARLTAGWQAGDGRTLFVVGDPMQSIYRFRQADVGLFLRAGESGIGGVPLERLRLWRNNRSDPAVLDWITATFPAVFPAEDDPYRGEIAYRASTPTRDAVADAGVRVTCVVAAANGDEEDGRATEDDLPDREAAAVLRLIEAEWRDDPARGIAVLVRSRGHLPPLLAALRAHPAGWRYAGVDIEPLADRPWVQDLLSLTRALHHRADRVHWLAVLRAPWCGLRLADLHALAADDHVSTLWALMNDGERCARLSADGQVRLAHVRDVLGEALAGQGRQSRRRWIEDAWRALGGTEGLDANGIADAMTCLARIETLDRGGRFSLDTLADDMAQLYAAADTGADGRLSIMTVHKAKGLEFDTVILPGLGSSPRTGDASLLAWDSVATARGERLLVAPMNRRGDDDDGPTAYDFLQGLERARAANEEARVLYVGATRAIRRLHLVGSLRVDKHGEAKPRGASPLARLWPVVGHTAVIDDAAAAGASTDASLLSTFVGRLVRVARVPAVRAVPPAPPPAEAPDEVDAFAAAIGTLVHACLEQIAGHLDEWPVDGLVQREPAFARWMSARGWAPAQAGAAARTATAMLATTLASEAGRWVLAAHAEGGVEVALANYSGGGAAPIRVVDRTFVVDGARWIIDYKTARVEGDAARHAQRYRAQLDGYAALFAAGGLPVRTGVLYVAHGTLVAFD